MKEGSFLLVVRIIEGGLGRLLVHVNVFRERPVQLVLLLLDVGPELRQRFRHRLVRVLSFKPLRGTATGWGGGGGRHGMAWGRLGWVGLGGMEGGTLL